MEIVENVLVVGDKQMVADLFHPVVMGHGGLPRLRTVIAPGGAKSGHTMGMRLCAFQEMGIHASRFDAGLATSAGSYNMVGYCAEQTHLISTMYQELSWLNPKVFLSALRGDHLGLLYLEKNLREMLDVETFKKCHMDLTIGLSDLKANLFLHKAKEADDIFDLMYASSALFPIVPGRVIKGVYSIDGGFTRRSLMAHWMRHILREISQEQEMDVLFLANRPHPSHRNWLTDWFEEYVLWGVMYLALARYPELMRGARSIDLKMRKAAEVFGRKHPRIRMCALYPMPDENIYPNEWRRYILQHRGERTRQRTEKFLKALKPIREI